MTEWRQDILGPGFECTDLDLGEDDEGRVVATLVRHVADSRPWWQRILPDRRELAGVDVLYVHGWSDYFFQRRFARFWSVRGANFYALDLRKYGRSLREGQTPGYIENLDDYDADLEAALERMGHGIDQPSGQEQEQQSKPDQRQQQSQPRRRLILAGHSTGGLVLSLWMGRRPGRAHALVLNSPWLEFQLTGMGRQMLAPLVDLRARFQAKEASPQLDFGYYSRAQREVEDANDPLEIDLRWRPERAHAISAGWLRAVLRGHARVSAGLGITVPVCVLLSTRSELPARWSEHLTRADTVLDVEEVARAALRLGESVTVERIDGALHDVFVSRHDARDEAYARLGRWVTGWAVGQRRDRKHGRRID